MGCAGSNMKEAVEERSYPDVGPNIDTTFATYNAHEANETVIEAILRSRRFAMAGEESPRSDTARIDKINVVMPKCKKTEDEVQLCVEALRSMVLSSEVDQDRINLLINEMYPEDHQPGTDIVTQGEQGDKFYIIRSGTCVVTVNGKQVATLGPGRAFGEIALLFRCPRAATVSVSTDVPASMFVVGRVAFRRILAQESLINHTCKIESLRRVDFLSSLDEESLDKLAKKAQSIQFRRGNVIIAKGDRGNILYVVEKGIVVAEHSGAGVLHDNEIHPGQYFGERALMFDEPRARTIVAKTDVSIVAIDREIFDSCIGSSRDVLRQKLIVDSLQCVPLLAPLSLNQKQELARHVTIIRFKAGDVVLRLGEEGDDFFIILTGEVTVHRPQLNGSYGVVATLQAGFYFGESALLDSSVRNADVKCSCDTECLVINRETFNTHMGSLQRILARIATRRQDIRNKIELAKTISLETLEFGEPIGIGTFGVVHMARHKPTGTALGVKVMWKSMLEESGQLKHVTSEKNILSMIRNPFVLKFYKSLQDEKKIYIVTELLLGGELFGRIVSRQGHSTPLDHSSARFYAACIALALEDLRDHSVAYRDLKPENVLLDSEGYARLVDFGFAKEIKDRSHTLCGTPEYLAPEMVLGTGHSSPVDCWALGVLIYEIIAGDSPFADPGNDHMKVCSNIIRGEVHFDSKCDPAWVDIVSRLLCKNPRKRLGCLECGFRDIKRHKWFANFDWNGLEDKTIKAPWIPDIKNDMDRNNFEVVSPQELQVSLEWDKGTPDKDNWESF